MRRIVVIPTYQEASTLPALLGQVLGTAPDLHVLVVDDASPDGTARIAAEHARRDPRVHLLQRPGKDGLGPAYRAGFGWALGQGYDEVAQMDADLSHPPDRLPALFDALGWADVAIGSRYVAGGTTRGWPRRREALSRLGNAYAQRALRLPVHDATAGFRAYRAPVLHAVGLPSVTSGGYCFQVEMTLRAVHSGFRVVELPITFTERAEGVSKMDGAVVVEALLKVTGWALCARVPATVAAHPESAHPHSAQPDSAHLDSPRQDRAAPRVPAAAGR